MEFFRTILKTLDTQMETPGLYGWFHLLFFALSIATAVFLCATHKAGDDRRVRRVVFIVAVITLVLEIYKQINFSFSYSGENIEFNFQWYAFPFQFCSMPMYVGLLTGIFRKGKVHDALCAFLATYAIFAGCCVMLYPVQVLVPQIGINVQTMICHGSMITVGAYLLFTQYVRLEHRSVLKAMPVFASAMALAFIMDEVAYFSGLLEAHDFNMFFISRHLDSTLPVYSLVHAALPYPIAVAVYFIAFSLAAYIILLCAMGIARLARRIKAKKSKKGA